MISVHATIMITRTAVNVSLKGRRRALDDFVGLGLGELDEVILVTVLTALVVYLHTQ